MADTKSSVAFARAAASFEVHESDFLVLTHDRITNFEAMAYRFPSSNDFEEYLRRSMRTRAAYRGDDTEIQVFPRPEILEWSDYKSTEDVGCLRKLWGLSTQAAKRQLERLAGDDGESKSKVTLATAQELEDKAVQQGMPEPKSDRERPSLHTLSKVQSVLGPSGTFQHLAWESYVSMEVEARLRRAGKLPKDKKEVILDEDKLKLKSTEDDFPETAKIDSILALKDTMELRARAFHLVDVCPYNVAAAYGEKIVEYLRKPTPEGMRAPTLNEARRADREILSEILKWVAKGKRSVEAGLTHYTSEADTEPLWRLLSQQPETLPDQGKEREGKKSAPPEEPSSHDKGVKRRREDESGDHYLDPERPRYCIVCRKWHWPRCVIPEGWRKEHKPKKSKGRGKGRGKGKKPEPKAAPKETP
eukprot:s489_g23.t1